MDWTLDRIQTLSKPEVKNLRANAERLQEPGVVALCDKVLGTKSATTATAAARAVKAAKPRKESQGD
ncbi:MAG: hypothetical protein WAO95_07675 [Burkholderiales bacterium]